MIYEYKCPECGQYKEITCHHTEQPERVDCEDCTVEMPRWFSKPQMIMPFTPYFDAGLGVQVNSKKDVKAAISKINGETGRNIEEIGDEDNSIHHKVGGYDSLIEDLGRNGVFDDIDNRPEGESGAGDGPDDSGGGWG